MNTPATPPVPAKFSYRVFDQGEDIAVIRSSSERTNETAIVALVPYYKSGAAPCGRIGLDEARKIAANISLVLDQGGNFAAAFNDLSGIVHATALEKGWWEKEDRICAKLADEPDLVEAFILAQDGKNVALFTAEASEALEAMRHGNLADDHIPEFSGVEAELADIIIRIMDVSKRRGWRVGQAIAAKVAYNATRERMHGGKKI